MSEKLLLPREWTQKSMGPVWKAAAIAGWAIAILLAQCLVMVLAWPALCRPTPPPPPEVAQTPNLAPRTHENLEISHSMARIRCLVAVGRSQEALAETIRCLTLCQKLEIDPPAELPALFADTVATLSAHSEGPQRPAPNHTVRPAPPSPPPISAPAPARLAYQAVETPACPGRVPGPGYPQAQPRPRLAPPAPVSQAYPMLPPPPPEEGGSNPPPPPSARYEFQPPPGAPPMPGGHPPVPGY